MVLEAAPPQNLNKVVVIATSTTTTTTTLSSSSPIISRITTRTQSPTPKKTKKSNLYEGVSDAVGSFITELLAHHVVVLIWNYPWG